MRTHWRAYEIVHPHLKKKYHLFVNYIKKLFLSWATASPVTVIRSAPVHMMQVYCFLSSEWFLIPSHNNDHKNWEFFAFLGSEFKNDNTLINCITSDDCCSPDTLQKNNSCSLSFLWNSYRMGNIYSAPIIRDLAFLVWQLFTISFFQSAQLAGWIKLLFSSTINMENWIVLFGRIIILIFITSTWTSKLDLSTHINTIRSLDLHTAASWTV